MYVSVHLHLYEDPEEENEDLNKCINKKFTDAFYRYVLFTVIFLLRDSHEKALPIYLLTAWKNQSIPEWT